MGAPRCLNGGQVDRQTKQPARINKENTRSGKRVQKVPPGVVFQPVVFQNLALPPPEFYLGTCPPRRAFTGVEEISGHRWRTEVDNSAPPVSQFASPFPFAVFRGTNRGTVFRCRSWRPAGCSATTPTAGTHHQGGKHDHVLIHLSPVQGRQLHRWRLGDHGEPLRGAQSGRWRGHRPGGGRRCGVGRAGHRRGRAGPARLAGAHRDRPLPAAAPLVRADHGAPGRTRPDHDHGTGQAPGRGQGRDRLRRLVRGMVRRGRQAGVRRDHPRAHGGPAHRRDQAAGGRGGCNHALEFPQFHDHPQGRPGPGGGLHLRPPAGLGDAAVRPGAGPVGGDGRLPAGCNQHRHRSRCPRHGPGVHRKFQGRQVFLHRLDRGGQKS